MSDSTTPPAAVPTQFIPWQPDDAQLARAADRAQMKAKRDAEDAARAVSGKTTLVCIAGFTIMSDEYPAGLVINAGQDFEVFDVDLHKYAGKGVRRAGAA